MDEAAKKRTLRMLPYAMLIVGTREPEVADPARDLHAFLGSWMTQCSFKPPLVAMAVRKDGHGVGMIRRSGVFTLNLLGAAQKDVATVFLKGASAEAGAFGGVRYETGETGAPVLPDAPATLECRVVDVHDGPGDHALVVGEVVAARHAGGTDAPLTSEETGWVYAG